MPTIPVGIVNDVRARKIAESGVGRPSTPSTSRQSRWNRDTGGLLWSALPGTGRVMTATVVRAKRRGSHAIQILASSAAVAAILLGSRAPGAAPVVTTSTNGVSPTFASIGPLTFNPDGTLFAGDAQSAAIYALDLGKVSSVAPGAADVEGIDQKIAALAGTDAAQITITDS